MLQGKHLPERGKCSLGDDGNICTTTTRASESRCSRPEKKLWSGHCPWPSCCCCRRSLRGLYDGDAGPVGRGVADTEAFRVCRCVRQWDWLCGARNITAPPVIEASWFLLGTVVSHVSASSTKLVGCFLDRHRPKGSPYVVVSRRVDLSFRAMMARRASPLCAPFWNFRGKQVRKKMPRL